MKLPEHSEQSAKIITEKLLVSMGYPKDIVVLQVSNISQERSKTTGSVQMGEFNMQSGSLTFNSDALKKIDTPSLVAILAHELDHFDKALKTAKAVGVNKYLAIFPQKNPSDAAFWNRTIPYANINNFDSAKYYNAIYRSVNMLDMDLISSYSDYFRLTEPLRNPVEVSGYSVSDKILTYYYGTPQNRGDLKRLSDIFNKVDMTVQSRAKSQPYLKRCVPAIFDYYYKNAALTLYPQFKQIYENCKNNKGGDLTDFWLQFEAVISDFYKQGKMSAATTEKVYNLLSQTYAQSQTQLNNDKINEIFVQKIMTMSANLYSQKAKAYTSALINDYMTFLSQTSYSAPKDELHVLIAGICIDNSVFKDNKDKINSVSNLKIRDAYKQKIYSNSEFNKLSSQYANKDECLVALVRSWALKKRVN